MNIRDLRKVEFGLGPNWRVTYNELYMLDPAEAEALDVVAEGISVWDLFDQDLIQIENELKGQLMDIGWYPSRRPDGAFRLLLVSRVDERRLMYDWKHPHVDFTTRSIEELLSTITTLSLA